MGTWLIEWGLLILAGWTGFQNPSGARPLSFEDRVRAQEAVERVYYEHRIWPKENPGLKPPFERMISRSQIEAKVEDTLKKSAVLDKFWQRPIQPEQLQAEMYRMARQTQDPETLKELFAALDNNPYLIAECLARPLLANRLSAQWQQDQDLPKKQDLPLPAFLPRALGAFHGFVLPKIADPIRAGSDQGRWRTLFDCPVGRSNHKAVWTGSEMIIWGGDSGASDLVSGGRYDPATDTWTAITASPDSFKGRWGCSVLWTGTEMIIWGGSYFGPSNTGVRYNPLSDSWIPTSTMGECPTPRGHHSAVWTGNEMIIWGGGDNRILLYTGGRYDPVTDSWKFTSTGSASPPARSNHSAVWTGTEMIIWGGKAELLDTLDSGASYDPKLDRWRKLPPGSETPSARAEHAAFWTGSEMIVWGGWNGVYNQLNSGARYDPSTDTWAPTSTGADCPAPFYGYTFIWTGEEMIAWAGGDYNGGRYDPVRDSWAPISANPPSPAGRAGHSAVWTGTEMIVWGGPDNSGGRYNPLTDSWVATARGTNPFPGRYGHEAFWTGAEMIIWDGSAGFNGVLYDPATNSWRRISGGAGCPKGRGSYSVVWTGSEMILWGGDWYTTLWDHHVENTGGRYDPVADSWQPTSTGENCPDARYWHSAVWTGTEMIVWGGKRNSYSTLNSGARYRPEEDSWTPIAVDASTASPRGGHTAIWTGSEMIVWGGWADRQTLDSGSRYDPAADAWKLIPANPETPQSRYIHTAIWTGREMVIWGGYNITANEWLILQTGGCYRPSDDSWSSTSTGNGCPSSRVSHTAIWTGTAMIVWGGYHGEREDGSEDRENTGGMYFPATDSWVETATSDGCPSDRYGHSAVWTGNSMIIWDGQPITGSGGIFWPCSSHCRSLAPPE